MAIDFQRENAKQDFEKWFCKNPKQVVEQQFNLTKREYFAAMAMQGLLANKQNSSYLTSVAINHADELLKHLESTKVDSKFTKKLI